MKFMFGLSVVLMSHFSMAFSGDDGWNRKALEAIDSICADTWCSGDYNYRFDSLKCDFGRETCVLRYRSAEWPAEGETMSFTRSGRCKLTGIRSPSDLIEAGPGVRLKDAPYDQITTCLP